MSHYWSNILHKPKEAYVRREVKQLRKYAQICIDNNNHADAMKALAQCIELSDFSLKMFPMSEKKQNKRMRENLRDLREYQQLEDMNPLVPFILEPEKPLVTSARPILPNKEMDELYSKFESCIQIPDKSSTAWDDIVGHKEVKDIILKSLKYQTLFKNNRGISGTVSGVLLYGPPGTGKSMLARAVCHKIDYTYMEITGSDILGKYQGEAEKNISQLFKLAAFLKPVVMFVDEIDSLCGRRESSSETPENRRGVTNQLLVALQGGIHNGVFMIGATNTPWQIDPAFLRRFDHKCYISLPEYEERKLLITKFLMKLPNSILDIDVNAYANSLEGYSASDIASFLKKVEQRRLSKALASNYFAKSSSGAWFLCHKNFPNGQKITYMNLPTKDYCHLPNISVVDFDLAMATKSSTVSEINKYNDFQKNMG